MQGKHIGNIVTDYPKDRFSALFNVIKETTDAEDGIPTLIIGLECAKKNIAFIAMKPLAGGAIDDAKLALRYVSRNPHLTVVIPGMYSSDEVKMNYEAVSDSSPLTKDELCDIEKIRGELGENFCRRCGYCAPCTFGINIPGVFLFDGYLTRYGLTEWAKGRYETLSVKASACVDCGACETRCPYNLPIRKMLKEAAERFGR